MKLTITNEAEHTLTELNKDKHPYLLLWYDTDDCGCGVNGLPMVGFTDNIKETYEKVENEQFPTYIQKQQAVFFHKDVKLSLNNGMFRLSSPDGMLNPFISPTSIKYID
jgi:uncharacterized protein YqkB